MEGSATISGNMTLNTMVIRGQVDLFRDDEKEFNGDFNLADLRMHGGFF